MDLLLFPAVYIFAQFQERADLQHERQHAGHFYLYQCYPGTVLLFQLIRADPQALQKKELVDVFTQHHCLFCSIPQCAKTNSRHNSETRNACGKERTGAGKPENQEQPQKADALSRQLPGFHTCFLGRTFRIGHTAMAEERRHEKRDRA